MAEHFDTSGLVHMPAPGNPGSVGPMAYVLWSDLSPFTQGYVEALFAAAFPVGAPRPSKYGGSYFPAKPPCFSDLAPETLARILEDCERYREEAPRLRAALDGKRFRAVRNDPTGCDGFPPLTPYLGDDGKVYLREGA